MKTIIAGSRDFTDAYEMVMGMATVPWTVTEVVCGKARGADELGDEWASVFNIPVVYFEPDWNKFGRTAGFIRNKEMAEYADALVAFWNGISPGTRNMIDTAKRMGLKVHIVMV